MEGETGSCTQLERERQGEVVMSLMLVALARQYLNVFVAAARYCCRVVLDPTNLAVIVSSAVVMWLTAQDKEEDIATADGWLLISGHFRSGWCPCRSSTGSVVVIEYLPRQHDWYNVFYVNCSAA